MEEKLKFYNAVKSTLLSATSIDCCTVGTQTSSEFSDFLLQHDISVSKLAEIISSLLSSHTLEQYQQNEANSPDKKYEELKTRNSVTAPGEKCQKEKMLYLSSHIDELTDDIEQLQNSLLNSPKDSKNEAVNEIREEVDDLSPIADKNASCWSVNGSHVFNECLNKFVGSEASKGKEEGEKSVTGKENRSVHDYQYQYNQASTKLNKLQDEYAKVKTKIQDYQQNNTTYLEEIKLLKEQLNSTIAELAQAKAAKNKEVSYSSISLKEVNEQKQRIAELERAQETDKEKIIQLENKCLKLKLDKEQLGIKLEKKSPLVDYLKTGINKAE